MQNRFAREVKHLLNAVLTSPGAIDTITREAVEIFSAAQSDRVRFMYPSEKFRQASKFISRK